MKLTFLLSAAFAIGPAFGQAVLPLLPTTVSTIPSNGDVNPYGVAYVPHTVPTGAGLQGGDILVSNFNDSNNLQGTGTSVLRISGSTNTPSLLFNGASRGIYGMTAALGVLSSGIVIVGNLPTADGTAATVSAGTLSFIDRTGNFLGSINNKSLIDGPWGLALYDHNNGTATVFVSNVLAGTVVRLTLAYQAEAVTFVVGTVIGSGFSHRLDPAALVLGPSGLLYDAIHDILYVASSTDNAVYALHGAGAATSSLGTGTLIYQDLVHLHGPLQMAVSPTGHLLVANSDGSNVDPNQPSELVEFTTTGEFIAQSSIDPNNGGAFGLALWNVGFGTIEVAYVDDNANTLTLVNKVIP